MPTYAIVDLESAGSPDVLMTFDDKDTAEAALPFFYTRRIRATVRRLPEPAARTTRRRSRAAAPGAAAPPRAPGTAPRAA